MCSYGTFQCALSVWNIHLHTIRTHTHTYTYTYTYTYVHMCTHAYYNYVHARMQYMSDQQMIANGTGCAACIRPGPPPCYNAPRHTVANDQSGGALLGRFGRPPSFRRIQTCEKRNNYGFTSHER